MILHNDTDDDKHVGIGPVADCWTIHAGHKVNVEWTGATMPTFAFKKSGLAIYPEIGSGLTISSDEETASWDPVPNLPTPREKLGWLAYGGTSTHVLWRLRVE